VNPVQEAFPESGELGLEDPGFQGEPAAYEPQESAYQEPGYQGYEPEDGGYYDDEAYERGGDEYEEQREQAIAMVDEQRRDAEFGALERLYPELSAEGGAARAVVDEAVGVAQEMGDPDLVYEPEFIEALYLHLREEGRLPPSSGYEPGPGPDGAESADPSGAFAAIAREQAEAGEAGRMFGF
jgi:hypothetical protein